MSIWSLPGRNQFCALAADLIDQALVTMLCAILGGAISVEYPLAVANVATSFTGEKPEALDIYYKGEDRVSLIKTLAEVPYGQTDLCLWFEGFNWQNPSLAASFGRQGYANADLLLYALAQPRPLRCFDCFAGTLGEEHTIQVCVRATGNRGPWGIAGTPLEALLARHFGVDVLVDRSYS